MIVAIEKNNKIIIPTDDVELLAGDKITVFGINSNM